MAINLARAKQRLEERRADLLSQGQATKESRRPVELDQTRLGRLSRMDALQSQAMSIETDRRRHMELARIDAALARINSGDYGYCLACGEEIEEARLTLNPATPNCVDCAQ